MRVYTRQRLGFTMISHYVPFAPLAEWVGVRVLGYEIRGRIKGFAKGCEDQEVLAAVRA